MVLTYLLGYRRHLYCHFTSVFLWLHPDPQSVSETTRDLSVVISTLSLCWSQLWYCWAYQPGTMNKEHGLRKTEAIKGTWDLCVLCSTSEPKVHRRYFDSWRSELYFMQYEFLYSIPHWDSLSDKRIYFLSNWHIYSDIDINNLYVRRLECNEVLM